MERFLNVLYGGIRPDIQRHGGAKCAAYLSTEIKIAETCISTGMMIICLVYALKRVTLPRRSPPESVHLWKKPLLALLCVNFGLEIGYKITSDQLLYILNPCHVITVVEVGAWLTVLKG